MARNTRLSKELAQQIRQAAKRMDVADMPSDAATAQEILLELHTAITNLREPIRALLKVATAGGDEDLRGVPANAERAMKRLATEILHAASED